MNSGRFTAERAAEFNRSRAVPFDDMYMPEPMSGCWLWLGGVDDFGYGNTRHAGKKMSAHRRSWIISHGEIPKGLWILHRCDNPFCVNPDHLYAGTRQQNSDDMVRRRRSADQRGDNNGHCRLTEQDIVDIRNDLRTHDAIAAAHGLSQSHVSRIKNRQAWRHLP